MVNRKSAACTSNHESSIKSSLDLQMNCRPVQLDQQEKFEITLALAGYIPMEGCQRMNVRNGATHLGFV